MDINRNNYETSFLLYLDRELNPSEMLAVEKFLSENTDLQKEFELLRHTVFLPEEIVYDHKELLFHKGEKRRAIPLIWFRIAASFLLLITAGWFILTKISNDHKREIAGSIQSQITKVPVAVRKDSANPDLSIKDLSDHKVANDIQLKKDEIIPGSEKGLAKKSEQSFQIKEKRKMKKNYPAETSSMDLSTGPDEVIVVMQKSNAAIDMQPERVRTANDPKQISVLPGTQAPTLLLAATATKNIPAYEKPDTKDQDLQSDNAISVVALNDQNKSITGLFKKLISQSPEDNKSNSARKVSVSVFQLSY